ncbi:MAG: class I SAM-dependent methyltransferase [Verrucomicrobiia bacterium]|jgi:SAM-dependent methyltransferase
MTEAVDFTDRYLRGETPWDSGKPSEELLRVLGAGTLTGKTVLEIGCGTGTNAVELARRGFVVTAVDIAEPAIRIARDKARGATVTVDFRVADVLTDDLGGPYDILFDSGVYHCLRTIDLKRFQEFLRKSTRPGSWWLSLAGNAKEDTDPGPPVVSEDEIRAELGPLFDVVELREFRFTTKKADFRPLAWSILMRRR